MATSRRDASIDSEDIHTIATALKAIADRPLTLNVSSRPFNADGHAASAVTEYSNISRKLKTVFESPST
jgi:hypothetical protein